MSVVRTGARVMDAGEVMTEVITTLDEADALDERLATAGLGTLSVAPLQTLADRLEARRRYLLAPDDDDEPRTA